MSDSDSDIDEITCDGCGKNFRTANSLAQHKRLYCRPNRDPTNTCPDCLRSFNTFAGLQQHRRKAHAAAYQAGLEDQDQRRTVPISRLETLDIARAEIMHEGVTPINKHLAARFGRPIEEVRNLRKRRDYLSLRARLEAEQKEAPDHPTSSPPRFEEVVPPAPRPPSPPAVWPSPPLPHSPSPHVHGVEGDEVFYALNLPRTNDDQPLGPSLAEELHAAMAAPSIGSTDSPPKSPDSPPPPGRMEAPVEDDPVKVYCESLILDPTTPPVIRALGIQILSPDATTSHGAIDELYGQLWTPPPSNRRGPRSPHTNTAVPALNARARRAYRFKRFQELFTKDRSSLASSIVSGIEPGAPSAAPSQEEVFDHYQDVFAGAAPPDPHAIVDFKEPIAGLYAPVTEESIKTAIQDRRASNSAGPDGMTARALRGLPLRGVAILFNAMLFTGHLPLILKKCRTTLIPKSAADLHLVTSWRPITVANILVRTLHRLIAARLAVLPLHPSQRGFISMDGTLANACILQAAIKDARDKIRPYSITALDLRKAFDTVPHSSVERALRRFNIDNRIARFILAGLMGCSTTISAPGVTTPPIEIQRGVKQGDPLSPLLFNLVLDELLCRLGTLPCGLQIGDVMVASLAYADDLLLLTPTPEDMTGVVRLCQRYFEARHMELNAGKCANITVKSLPSRKKLYLSTATTIYIGATPIPRVEAEASFKYLGHRYGFMGTDAPSPELLKTALSNLRRAPLKPHQKLRLIQEYILPRFLYSFQNPRVTLAILDKADKAVRRAVKEAIHIPISTANALLYASRRDGGLGLMCLTAKIPDILLGRLDRLARSEDPHVAAALSSSYLQRARSRLESFLQPFGTRGQQRNHWKNALSSRFSGAGLPEHSSHPSASQWILDPPPYWSGADYVLAAQLRTNTLPTIGGLQNARLAANQKLCRGGCDRTETISHILQRCPVTHHQRIARHDHALGTLARACSANGHTSLVEPSIRGTDGRLHRPDLVAVKDNRVNIVDVSINWETPQPLSTQFLNKVAIYSDPAFLEQVSRKYPDHTIYVGAIVIGARGTWCDMNDAVFHRLGLSTRTATTLISGVLHGGTLIHRAFGALVWDRQPQRRVQHH